MSKVVRFGFEEYRNKDDNIKLFRRELRVNVYGDPRVDLPVPQWSIRQYSDEEGLHRSGERYYQDYESAICKFLDSLPRYTVGIECPKCKNPEALYIRCPEKYQCLNCKHEW